MPISLFLTELNAQSRVVGSVPFRHPPEEQLKAVGLVYVEHTGLMLLGNAPGPPLAACWVFATWFVFHCFPTDMNLSHSFHPSTHPVHH